MSASDNTDLTHHRNSLLRKLEDSMEVPMLVLSFVWLLLMIVEFTRGLSPFLTDVSNLIWFLFVIDFILRFSLAPSKVRYLKHNWVTTVALLLPAFRLFRIFRAIRILRFSRALRTLRLARVLTSLNRGISALGKSLSRRGFGYVMALTLIVLLAGAAAMLSFEKDNAYISDYGTALWWTAMTLTTMGADYFPKSGEGRLLCLLLAIYGFAIFGYVTAAVATFFVGRDANNDQAEIAGGAAVKALQSQVQTMDRKIEELLGEIRKLRQTGPSTSL